MRILGVDPGSRLTGFGCVEVSGRSLRHIAHGTLKLCQSSTKGELTFEERLLRLHQGLTEVIQTHKPDVMAVEKVFFAKNAVSSLKLGQARGVVILTGMIHSLQLVEYSATQVKQVVTGYGQSDKQEVARMVQLLTGQSQFSTPDASDGLALAICHVYLSRTQNWSQTASSLALKSLHTQRKKKKMSLAEALEFKIRKKEQVK